MAINDPNYRYATQTWEADGVRTQYEIAFDGGYIRQSDVVAFSVLVDPETGLVTDRTVHALTFVDETLDPEGWAILAHVSITPAVATGRRVVIFRSTEKSVPMVNYEDDSILTERNLDLANKQAIFAIAEIMDGLNSASIDINAQVQQVIDMNQLINNVYTQVLELLASGGIISVTPQVWFGVGNVEGDTDFAIPGADVDAPGFYDTYLNGVGLEPGVDYQIITGATPADTAIRFTVAPPVGIRWFTVLRGYAKPHTAGAPVTSLRMPIIDAPGEVFFVDKVSEFAVVRCTNVLGCEVTVNEIPTAGLPETKLGTGSYLSVTQRSSGVVTVAADPGVTLVLPADCLPQTRAINSTISMYCEYADSNTWVLGGDLARSV